MAYVYDYATTYASFQPAKQLDPARDLRLGAGQRGPSPSPPAPTAGQGQGASAWADRAERWSPWALFGTPLACPSDEGSIVLIWTWVRYRELPPAPSP